MGQDRQRKRQPDRTTRQP